MDDWVVLRHERVLMVIGEPYPILAIHAGITYATVANAVPRVLGIVNVLVAAYQGMAAGVLMAMEVVSNGSIYRTLH